MFARLDSLPVYSSGPPAWEMVLPTVGLACTYQFDLIKTTPTDMIRGQPNLDNLTEIPFPADPSLCPVDN